jgi:NCS1 family nucleobase:cation symporter-1
MVPWKIIANGASLLAFLGSYTVFLCPIAGFMIVDYYLIRKGNIHVPSVYDASPTGLYRYYKGWNWRALVAWVCGVVIVIHGVAGSIPGSTASQVSKNMYKLGFIVSLLMGSSVYYVLCKIWPFQTLPEQYAGLSFEELALNDGYFDGESEKDITGDIHGIARSDTGSEVISESKVTPEEKGASYV